MRFERSIDYLLIREIQTADERSYEAHRDDFAPSLAEYEPNRHPAIWYVIAREDQGTLLGLFVFVPLNTVCYEVHNCLLRRSWGPRAAEAGRGVLDWMFANSPARRIVGATPADLRLAVAFAKRCGMVEYGRNPRSFQRGGELRDLILMGISKEGPPGGGREKHE